MVCKYEKINENTGRITVTVEKDVFVKKEDEIYQKEKHKFNLPGFRKGHASKDILYKTYGEGVFFPDAMEAVIREFYDKTIEEAGVDMLSAPKVDIVQVGLDKDFIYTQTFAIIPDFKLPQYKGVKYKETKVNITDKDVEKRLKEEQEKNAVIVSVDRPIKKGDTAIIDFEGFIDGKAFKGGKAENFKLVIGSGSFIDNFEDQLIGKKAQDEVDVNVTFPDDYGEKSLSGKPALFKVKIQEVKEKKLPKIDDEFVSEISEFDKLEDYKKDIKEKLNKEGKEKAIDKDKRKIIEEIVTKTEINLSDEAKEHAVDKEIENMKNRLQHNGINFNDYLKMMNLTKDLMKNEYRQYALDHLKSDLVLEKIAEEENIQTSDEKVERFIKSMADGYRMDVEKFKSQFITSNEIANIKMMLLKPSVVDFIYENAKKE